MTLSVDEAKQLAQQAARGSQKDTEKLMNAIVTGDITLMVGGVAVTATAAEINKLDGAGAVVASGTQAALISDPAGGSTTDAEARTAINALIDACQAFGIVASS